MSRVTAWIREPLLFRATLVLAGTAGLLVLAASDGSANTWHVNADGTGDAPTLQAAVNLAASGDSILLANGTYTGAGNREIVVGDKAIYIASESGDATVCVIDCMTLGRGFLLDESLEPFTMEDLTIVRAVGVVARYQDGAAIRSFRHGGTIRRCRFYACTPMVLSDDEGFGWDFEECCFEGNASGVTSHWGAVTLLNCALVGNSGMGVYAMESGPCTFTGCRFVANAGGALSLTDTNGSEVSDCVFKQNGGSAVHLYADAPQFIDCVFEDNTGYEGGAVFGDWSAPTFEGCTFAGNSALSAGGAIVIRDYGVTLINTLLVANSAPVGGCLYSQSEESSFYLTSCILYGNTSSPSGAIIHLAGGSSCTASNSILASSIGGAAVSCQLGSYATFTCSDVFGNDGGDWTGCLAGQDGANGNITADPLFCDAVGGDFHLGTLSPCLNTGCGTMGGFGLGCFDPRPDIIGIDDVGNDEGRHARLVWHRSLYDAPGDAVVITGYAVYRRQDLFALAPERLIGPGRGEGAVVAGWDYIATVPARGDSVYQCVAPTLCDSTIASGQCWSAFFISAMTPDPLVFFDSPVDSGYSKDNLPPSAPGNFAVTYNTGVGNQLVWDAVAAGDFGAFRVYRGPTFDFAPSVSTRVHTTAQTSWTDPDYDGWNVYYKVSAVDASGNESAAVSPSTATGVGGATTPTGFVLHQNVPNPFNPGTVIPFDVPRGGGRVTIVVYEVTGRRVCTLVDGLVAEGHRSVPWDGRDEAGRSVASGVYFVRMQAGAVGSARKLVVAR